MKISTNNLAADRKFKSRCDREARRIAKQRAKLKALADRDKKGMDRFHD